MFEFVSGLITMGFLITGLFFLRFWRRTHDFLFACFAAAFWLLAINQGFLAFARIPIEERSWIYLLRLAAFCLILVGILWKNRGR